MKDPSLGLDLEQDLDLDRLGSRTGNPGGAVTGGAVTGGAGAGGSGHGEATRLLAAISAVRRTARRAVRQAWPGEPLPTSQSELLRLVAERPGITVAVAARELRLAPNTVSTLVGRLAARGLISRQRARPDGRTVSLDLTTAAVKRLADRRDLRAELAQQVLVQLPEADQRALIRAVPALLQLAEGLAEL